MKALVAEALRVLAVDQLVCAVHDRCLPSVPDEDIGCGAPGSRGAEAFIAFLSDSGFTGVQLGPAGEISAGNLSPYDGTAFSRSSLNLAWEPLIEGDTAPRLLDREQFEQREPAQRSDRCDYPRAFVNQGRLLGLLHDRWDRLSASDDGAAKELNERLAVFRASAGDWLVRDGLYQVLSRAYGRADATAWANPRDARLFSRGTTAAERASRVAELSDRFSRPLERHAREQCLLSEQHHAFRHCAHQHALVVYGDLQIGLSLADRWSWSELLLDQYCMGAPPSRTNPEGQPWGYPILDPALLGTPREPGPALAFHRHRFEKLFAEYDGIRLDHPHGLVCPWVYQSASVDPYAAVQAGARLFSVGPPAAHSRLGAFDIARMDQLAIGVVDPWADDWVTALDDEQVGRYAAVFDTLMQAASAAGVPHEQILCEVLSTQPYPLGCVISRHGLGRFRVTSKADVTRADDVYLPENAHPEDWIMVGTHDTPPIWHTARAWSNEQAAARARYAAARLAPDGVGQTALAEHFAGSRDAMALAEFALLFTSPARQVMIFVCDLLGERSIYNRPGIVDAENWTWRVSSDFRPQFDARVEQGAAVDLFAVLALAVAALPAERRSENADLLKKLIEASRAPLPALGNRLPGLNQSVEKGKAGS